jgi:hypothetical protein
MKYWYHTFNGISYGLTHSDPIQRCPLHMEAMCIVYMSMFMFSLDSYVAEPWYHVMSVTLLV